MNLKQLKEQKKLLKERKRELERVPIETMHSQMNLRGGRMNQLQRQQDHSFNEIVIGQKKDVKKKISSISNLIRQKGSEDFTFLENGKNQIHDFSITKTPTKRNIRNRGRIQEHMGFFLE